MTDTNLSKEVTTSSFRTDVIAESAKQPVLVDFWAPWCGPCKQLTPLLESVVSKANGKVKLVTMNIDEHPQIAGQLGVQSIPAVFAFQKGQPVDGFMGALPLSQIKAFVERLVGPLEGEEVELYEAGLEALKGDHAEAAAQLFTQALAINDTDAKSIAGLAKSRLVQGKLQETRAVLEGAPSDVAGDAAIIAVMAELENAERAAELGDLPQLENEVEQNPRDFQKRVDLAIALNAHGRREEAADALLYVIKHGRSWNDDGARKQLLQFFDAWGPMDPDTLSARRKLSGVLFS